MPGVTRKWIENLSQIELFILNTIQRNKKHLHCRLVIKEAYCDRLHRKAIFCADHDHFLTWLKDDTYNPQHTLEYYELMGLNIVEYPDDDYRELMRQDGGLKPTTVTVKNLRTKKSTKIWYGYKGNPYRDPSMPEYWEFIDKFL